MPGLRSGIASPLVSGFCRQLRALTHPGKAWLSMLSMLRFTGGLCSSRNDPTRQLRLSKMVLGPQWTSCCPVCSQVLHIQWVLQNFFQMPNLQRSGLRCEEAQTRAEKSWWPRIQRICGGHVLAAFCFGFLCSLLSLLFSHSNLFKSFNLQWLQWWIYPPASCSKSEDSLQGKVQPTFPSDCHGRVCAKPGREVH